MIKKVDAEIIQCELEDLSRAVHIMCLGFEALRESEAVGCLSLIEHRLKQMSCELKDESDQDGENTQGCVT